MTRADVAMALQKRVTSGGQEIWSAVNSNGWPMVGTVGQVDKLSPLTVWTPNGDIVIDYRLLGLLLVGDWVFVVTVGWVHIAVTKIVEA